MKLFWRDLTTADLEQDTSGWIAILPLAAIEQHGPHLPLATDAIIAEGMVERCAGALPEESPALFLPVQQIGKSNEHVNFPGTLTLNWETAIKSWIEIGESIARAGLRKLVLITSHGGNVSSMDIVARELRANKDMLVVCTSWEKLGKRREIFKMDDTNVDIHGGEVETSIMLAMQPHLVDMVKAENFASNQTEVKSSNQHLGYHSSNATISWLSEDLNSNGVVGNASVATMEKGLSEIEGAVQGFCELIEEIDQSGL